MGTHREAGFLKRKSFPWLDTCKGVDNWQLSAGLERLKGSLKGYDIRVAFTIIVYTTFGCVQEETDLPFTVSEGWLTHATTLTNWDQTFSFTSVEMVFQPAWAIGWEAEIQRILSNYCVSDIIVSSVLLLFTNYTCSIIHIPMPLFWHTLVSLCKVYLHCAYFWYTYWIWSLLYLMWICLVWTQVYLKFVFSIDVEW